MQESLGKQILSSRATAPSCGVGTEQRKSLATKNGVPGPGLYKVRSRVFVPDVAAGRNAHIVWVA